MCLTNECVHTKFRCTLRNDQARRLNAEQRNDPQSNRKRQRRDNADKAWQKMRD